MKIDKKSWHYRFLNFVDNVPYELRCREVYSLCPYVRRVIFSMLGAVVGVFGFILALIFSACFLSFYWDFAFFLGFWEEVPLSIAVISSILNAGALYGIGYLCFTEKVEEYRDKVQVSKRDHKRELKNKAPGIFKEYYNSFHSKVCPLVELDND